jgi:MYXO-CTERM domain-containing protein
VRRFACDHFTAEERLDASLPGSIREASGCAKRRSRAQLLLKSTLEGASERPSPIAWSVLVGLGLAAALRRRARAR